MKESSRCSTSSLAFEVVHVLDFGRSNRCVVVSGCFNFQFPDDMCGASFYMLVCHLCIIFSEVSTEVFDPFLKLDYLSYC